MLRRAVISLLSLTLPLTAAWRPALALDVDITGGEWHPINIFIQPFGGEGAGGGQAPSAVIGDDLTASGRFRVFAGAPDIAGEALINDARARGGEYLLSGEIRPAHGGGTISFALQDLLTGGEIGAYEISYNSDNRRLAAHSIANWIYEEITEEQGVFHTKVAYVLRTEEGSELKVADYDGHNRQTLLSGKTQIISPAWTPDGNGLLYVSFERNRPIIYRQSLLTGERRIVANFKGSNSAPAMSPDRRSVAAALTEHGGAQQIYLIDGGSKTRLRASDNGSINTEPTFSPDGKRLAFTSDEDGTPQIYEYALNTAEAKRLTYGSRYNVSPGYSSDGGSIVFVRRGDGGDNVAVLDIASGRTAMLTNIRLADSPSFAPNDDMIIFRDEKRKRNLATVSINGKVMVFWRVPEQGEIIDPAWSPLKSDWF